MTMLRDALAVARDEARHLLHTRPMLYLMLFGVPLLYTLLIGAVYSEQVVSHIPLAIYDGDQTRVSRQYAQLYHDSMKFDVREYVATEDELAEEVNSGHVLAGIAIPPLFTHDILTGQQAQIGVFVNATNNIFSNNILSNQSQINRTFRVAVLQQVMQKLGTMEPSVEAAAYPVELRLRLLGNPTISFSYFMLIGILLNGVQISLMLTVPPGLVREATRPRYARRVSALAIVLGKLLPSWAASLASGLLSIAVMHLVFGVPVRGSTLTIAALLAAFCFFVIGALEAIASCCPDDTFSLQAPLVYIMPGILVCGLSWPLFAMTTGADFYSSLLPLRYTGPAMRDLLLLGSTPALAQDLAHSLLGGGIGLLLASLILHLRRVRYFKRHGKELTPDDPCTTISA